MDDDGHRIEREPLPEELILLEYEALPDAVAWYRERNYFSRYWTGAKPCLKLDFEGGEPCIRARHFVGLMPFSREGKNHLIMVAPKGSHPNRQLGLLRFLELVSIATGEPLRETETLSFKSGRSLFFAVLAVHFARLLQDVCRRDFRCYFHAEQGDLRGRIKGRIHVGQHIRNTFQGRANNIPCRWEEFTPDNWDNRILLAAVRRLQQSAARLAPEAARFVGTRFLGIEQWFCVVEDVPVQLADFNKARLWRTSRYYRSAIAWARLIIGGLSKPSTGGNASPFVIDANDAFERFASVVTKAAVGQTGEASWNTPGGQVELPFGPYDEGRRPDLLIRNGGATVAVGDAKYKDIIEQNLTPDELGDLHHAIVPKISSADWNQLYVYMRLTNSCRGFFVVPFWNDAGNAAELITNLQFAVSPLDRSESRHMRLAVVGLNLIRPLHQVKAAAASQLAAWLRV